jgi:AcrR family transcriptional regulator
MLVTAAFESLRHDGFRGTTARAIAARAQANQAAIYYHFGGIDELLLEALRQSSERRLDRYEETLGEFTDLATLIDTLEMLYVEDVESGHMAVLAELMGGVTANVNLRSGLEETTQPWLDFVEQRISDVAGQHPMGALVPARDLADLLFSIVTGLELRNNLDGNVERAPRLFRLARLLLPLVATPPTT